MRTLIICLYILLLGFADSFAQTSVPIKIDTTTREYPISKNAKPGILTGEYHISTDGTKYPILMGPRGGKYYITKNNTKRYIHK